MQWKDQLSVLTVRAMEEADVSGADLPLALRGEATRAAAASQQSQFLVSRAQWLLQSLGRPAFPCSLWPSWLPAALVAAAFISGWGLTEMGQSGVINLLALPLVGVLVWNAIMLLWGLLLELRKEQPTPPAITGRSAEEKFSQMLQPQLAERRAAGLRRLLHTAAAALALGSIAGLYGKGWSTEYRAVWESTLLDHTQAETFFRTLYGPGASVFQLELPLAEIPQMRRRPGQPVHAAPALPWIQLHAATLLLGVVLPRSLLLLLSHWRSRQRQGQLWAQLGWAQYEQRLQKAQLGSGQHLAVLLHQTGSDATAVPRYAQALAQELGAGYQQDYLPLPAGAEEDFLTHWQPTGSHVAVVFNAATTPEQEVHVALVQAVQHRVQQAVGTAQCLVLLDSRSLHQRRDSAGAQRRLGLWRELLAGQPVVECA